MYYVRQARNTHTHNIVKSHWGVWTICQCPKREVLCKRDVCAGAVRLA